MNLAQAYRHLRLSYGSPRNAVVAAFRRLALELHPDHAVLRGTPVAAATKAFVELRRAYEVIAAAGFPTAKMPPVPPVPSAARRTIVPPTPNLSGWNAVIARQRRQDDAERAAARVQAAAAAAAATANAGNANAAANEDSERCVFLYMEISTAH